MKLLVIQFCNYVDYPTGGHLSFVRNMLQAYPEGELALVGISTDHEVPVGRWCKRTISGKSYDYFSLMHCQPKSFRPLIPARLTAYLAFRRYRKAVLKYEFDLIFLQTCDVLFALPEQVLSQSCMCLPGVKNSLTASRYGWARKLNRIYDALFFKKAPKLKAILASALSQEISNLVVRSQGKLSRQSIIKFPTRYDQNIFYPRISYECRKLLNLSHSAQIFVTTGRLATFKGWQFLLDSFELLLAANPNRIFIMIGDGEDEQKIRNYIKAKNLTDHVILTGRKLPWDVALYLNAADVYLMGSFYEGWSTTLVEACACGVPSVVTAFSSAEDMIKDGFNGFVLHSRKESAFAKLVEKALLLKKENVIEFNLRYRNLSIQDLSDSIIKSLMVLERRKSRLPGSTENE